MTDAVVELLMKEETVSEWCVAIECRVICIDRLNRYSQPPPS